MEKENGKILYGLPVGWKDIFYEVKEKQTMRSPSGREINKTLKYRETDMGMSLVKYSKELKETTRDGFQDTFSSDTDEYVQ